MKRLFIGAQHQRGAVAIMFALSIFVLFGFMGLALDLSQTYDRKTELQNASDAAALAGAKELKGTSAGIDSAVQKAKAIAALHKFKFGTSIVLADAAITFSDSPDTPNAGWLGIGAAQANPGGLYFIKVDTRDGNNGKYGEVNTYFMQVLSASAATTNTFGRAVAGTFVVDIAPLAMCELTNDPANSYDNEFGYERGGSYNVADANPIGAGTAYAIDPTATAPGTCSGSTNDSLPYFCTGKIAFTPIIGQSVYTNTGIADPQLEALDSRFDVFNNKNKCDAKTAPPDSNIKSYDYTDSAPGSPRDWMNPVRQSMQFALDPITGVNRPVPLASRTFNDYGVLWSASRPAGSTVSQWPLTPPNGGYGGNATSYPETSPYAQGSGNFFQAPTTTGKPERRVLNLAIVTCPAAGGSCRPATVRGIGKFFMQRKANVPSDKNVYVEFEGLLDPALLNAEIRLYK